MMGRTEPGEEAEGKRENTDIMIMMMMMMIIIIIIIIIIIFELTSPQNLTWAVGFQLSS
jgi:heme/copper-type cytochrome/quinol oxidase subunit 2